MRVRIAKIDRQGVSAVFLLDGRHPLGGFVESLLPADLFPLSIVGTPNRTFEPIRIFLDVLQSDGLGTDMAAAEGVVAIASNRRNDSVLDLDPQTTGRLTQIADAEMG